MSYSLLQNYGMRIKNDVKNALKRSLIKLNLDYVDLFLIHWPFPNFMRKNGKIVFGPSNYEVCYNMEMLVQKGLVRSLECPILMCN